MSGMGLAIPTGRSHILDMMLFLKLAPALAVLALALALVVLSLPAPLYA